MYNNLIQNEYDIFAEIYNKLTYCEQVLNETLSHNKISKLDKNYALNVFKNEACQSINLALLNSISYNYFDYNNIKNKILPDNYLKPNEQILNIIKNINGLNQENLNKIEKEIIKLVNSQKK